MQLINTAYNVSYFWSKVKQNENQATTRTINFFAQTIDTILTVEKKGCICINFGWWHHSSERSVTLILIVTSLKVEPCQNNGTICISAFYRSDFLILSITCIGVVGTSTVMLKNKIATSLNLMGLICAA